MTRSQQVGVLGVLLVGIVGIGGWRTYGALQEARGPRGRKQSNAEWQQHLKVVSVDAEAPEGFQPIEGPNFDCAGLPNTIPLGRFRWRELISTLEAFDDRAPFPLFNKAVELRGNCMARGSIDDRGEDLEAGEGWLDVTIGLTHTGKVPFASMPRRHQPLCMIFKVAPGGEGERAGLKRGDVVVSMREVDLSKQLVAGDVCIALVDEVSRAKPDETFAMQVIRDGVLTSFPRRGAALWGINFWRVPVLDSDLTH